MKMIEKHLYNEYIYNRTENVIAMDKSKDLYKSIQFIWLNCNLIHLDAFHNYHRSGHKFLGKVQAFYEIGNAVIFSSG